MRLSKYFTLDEMTASETAARRGIANTPGPDEILALRRLCENILDPLRELAGAPIVVSSGFRNPRVNKLVGGSATSQHLSGCAADIKCTRLTQQELFSLIRKSGLPFDQCIDEYGDSTGKTNIGWCHVSYTEGRPNRGQVLMARRVGKKTVYTPL